ncbi:hypothetical protein QBC38DRAFT_491472 [Podospora fimiseda]|uniref:PinX1-related protein 1 n=1 Tax=Podospora fimiseda TaxID=252190 RepID=A0AAN7BF51_9PEZI|nr:hypothetical protein QBC38DRAFT_491472 [Podospora fimiseda]
MGLAGAKNKRRLGNDPNNTKWSRNTESFGQRMLRSQGWEPGQYLGAKDASHTEYHSEASTSHIRVVLKDDMLGLGAKRNNGDECTGLDAFQHLLGRLNGKSEEVLETEKRERDNLKLNLYLDRKVGTIRFVPGGFLVGDVVKDKLDEDAANSSDGTARDVSKESREDSTETESVEKKSKKRKAERDDTDRDEEKARKKEKKTKRRNTDSEAETDSASSKDKKKEKKERKSKKRNADSDKGDAEPTTSSKSSSKRKKDKEQAADESSDDAKKAKKEKKKLKKQKKERKEKRRKDRAVSESGSESLENSSKETKPRKEDKTPADSSVSTPSGSGYLTPVTTSTRYLARSRFIAQKKMAFADTAALNQIFMIKS